MAITIGSVTGLGGNPPTHLRVEGTVSGCEILQVWSTCTTNAVQVPLTTGGQTTWTADLPNDKRCMCGDPIKVDAWCGLGAPDSTTIRQGLAIVCDGCPSVAVTADPPGLCDNGRRSVTFHGTVNSLPAGGVNVLQWAFPNAVAPPSAATLAFAVTANGPLPSQTVDYAAPISGSATETATLHTVLPAGCPPVSVSVTVDPCPSCCPSLTLAPITVTGCAPGGASASFTASLSWPSGCVAQTPTSYEWTLNGPGGRRYQRSTSQPTTNTSAGWATAGSASPAPVSFAGGGNYSLSVTAVIPGLSSPCNPTDTQSFAVAACCPQLIGPLNATQRPNDRCSWSFFAQLSNPNGVPLTFDWTFHDGTTASTTAPQVDHSYAPGFATPGPTSVTMSTPGCPDQSLSVEVTPGCSCSTVSLTATPTTGRAPLAVSFQAVASDPGAILADAQGNRFLWDFGDGTTARTPGPSTTHTYGQAGSFTATVTLIVPPSCPAATASTRVTPTDTGDGDGGFNPCAALLIVAVALLTIGAVLVILGVCLGVPWLWIAGIVVGALGLLLFGIWAAVCARTTACSVMRVVHCILFWIVSVIAPIILLLAAIFGGLPCAIATAAAWGGWGTLYAWLGFIMRRVGCGPTC